MAFVSYAAHFRDRRGEDDATVETDGRQFRLLVRGYTLSGGWSFDGLALDRLSPTGEVPFDLDENGWLRSGEVEFALPITVAVAGRPQAAEIRLSQNLDGRLWGAEPELHVGLTVDRETFSASSCQPEYEGGFTLLRDELPPAIALRCSSRAGSAITTLRAMTSPECSATATASRTSRGLRPATT